MPKHLNSLIIQVVIDIFNKCCIYWLFIVNKYSNKNKKNIMASRSLQQKPEPNLDLEKFNISPEDKKNPWWVQLSFHICIIGNLFEFFIYKSSILLIFAIMFIYYGYGISKFNIKAPRSARITILLLAIFQIYCIAEFIIKSLPFFWGGDFFYCHFECNEKSLYYF